MATYITPVYGSDPGYGQKQSSGDTGCLDNGNYFFDTKSRHNFIFKVYSILNMQLLFTCLFTVAVYTVPKMTEFVGRSQGGVILLWICVGLTLLISIILSCFVKIQRQHPWNMILLFAFTACESYLISFICIHYQIKTLLTAFGVTILIVTLLTIFACQTKWDFTTNGWMIGLFIALIAVLVLSMLNTFIFGIGWLETLIASVMLIIFCFYLIYDTQMIIGGNHANEFSEEDYVFAALSIYMDIIMIFLQLLKLLNGGSDDN